MYAIRSYYDEVSFEIFCEYILPYRLGNEPLENWRNEVLKDTLLKLTGDTLVLFDSLEKITESFVRMQSALKKNYKPKYGKENAGIPDMPFSILKLITVGSCANMSKRNNFV